MCALSAAFTAFEILSNHTPGRTAGCLLEVMGKALGWGDVTIAGVEVVSVLLFAALFWQATQSEFFGGQRSSASFVALSIQGLIGLSVGSELTGLVSLTAALALARIPAQWFVAVLVLLQTASYYWLHALTGGNPLENLIAGSDHDFGWTMALMAATTVVWNGLAFSLGLFGVAERRRARALARANAELAAARQLEAETARIAVRLGISRDLHDASGHHLAALNVNLRLIRRLPDLTQITAKIDECLFIVGQLLNEVRAVVKDLRSLQRIDLRAILRTMCAGFDGLQVHLGVDEDLAEAEPYYAQTLFRCTQEILTNAAKHGDARNVWIVIHRDQEGYRIEGRDDGKGVSEIHFGNGLTGMRERVMEFGGDFAVHSRIGEGFTVRLLIPVRGQIA